MQKILYIPTYNKESLLDQHIKKDYKKYLKEETPDIIFVSGGDGSLLHAIQDYSYLGVPFFGIANGTKNFLMNDVNFFNLNEQVFDIIEASSLFVTIDRPRSNGTKKTVFESMAINDIVIGNKVMDYNDFKISNLFEKDFNIQGLGLVFSTTIGSTAFFKNNGGEVIKNISSKNIIGVATIVSEKINSFNGHYYLKENIIVSIESKRTIPFIFIDGEAKVFELKYGDIVNISIGPSIKLAFKDVNKFLKKRNNS